MYNLSSNISNIPQSVTQNANSLLNTSCNVTLEHLAAEHILRETGQNGNRQNGIRTKWYTDKMLYGQNGIWTEWYTDKMVLDKMVWTKWYRQYGTYKVVWIKWYE